MPPSSTTKSAAKSLAKSSHSSLQSAASASSLSKAVRSSAKVIGRGIKCIKKGASAIARPLKRAKHALSNVSSPVDSEAEHSLASDGDQDSLNTADLPEVFEVDSDGDEVDNLGVDEPNLAPTEDSSQNVVGFTSFGNLSVTNRRRTSEIQEYLSFPVENVIDPLKWWTDNKYVYPNLHCMALDYLSIPGMSDYSNLHEEV